MTTPATHRSQDTLRTFASELPRPDNPYDDDSPGPFELARAMVDHNNTKNGAALDFTHEWRQASDHRWWEIAWVFDTKGMTEDGGDVVMCWWQQIPCPDCQGQRWIDIHHHSHDGVIGGFACGQKHPEPPPPPVSLVKPHRCTGPLCCPPF